MTEKDLVLLISIISTLLVILLLVYLVRRCFYGQQFQLSDQAYGNIHEEKGAELEHTRDNVSQKDVSNKAVEQ